MQGHEPEQEFPSVRRRTWVENPYLELDVSSVGLQEQVEFSGRSWVSFVEGPIAFFKSVVSLVATFRHGSIDGTNVDSAKVKGIDCLLGYFGLRQESNSHERVDDNWYELPRLIPKELIVSAVVDFLLQSGDRKDYAFLGA
jgi:hypothetical protein